MDAKSTILVSTGVIVGTTLTAKATAPGKVKSDVFRIGMSGIVLGGILLMLSTVSPDVAKGLAVLAAVGALVTLGEYPARAIINVTGTK